MSSEEFALKEKDIKFLLSRYWEAIRNGEIDKRIRPTLSAVLPLFDAPRPGRVGRDRPI